MALDINGYNESFRAFVNFASTARSGSTIAQISGGNAVAGTDPLAGRTIVAKTMHDSIGNVGRLAASRDVNNDVRDLFMKTVIDMFGGESKIPQSVIDAMKLADYGKGKPLTARRILAVQRAIDAEGTAAALGTLKPEAKAVATGMGYAKSELPKLARATKFYAQATGKSEEAAMRDVAEPGSKANRLMNYGGRFMESAANFADGLNLLDTFAAWHDNLAEGYDAIKKNGGDYSVADTPSKLNVDTSAIRGRNGLEKFIFESIAANPSANLKETDGEKIFGFKNNGASRFVGQGFTGSCANTMANIPPAKREVVFKVFDLFCPMCETAGERAVPSKDRQMFSGNRTRLLGRILRHLDDVIALDAKGRLTAENFIRKCVPDMVKARATGNWDFKALDAFFDSMDDELNANHSKVANVATLVFETTGGTLDEVLDFLENGKPLPPAQYASQGQMPLENLDTVEGGFDMITADLDRPAGYNYLGSNEPLMKAGPDAGFGFNFPGEDRFATNSSEAGKANIPKVRDNVLKMCGSVHPKQASNVMLMLSQSGLGPINRGLTPYGLFSSEHSAVDYTLSKDDNTGSVTIKYSSPAVLPFRFEWTATVDVEGNMTTTPMKFEKPVEMNAETAAKYVKDAVKATGVNLNSAQRQQAAAYLVSYGGNMYEQNARMLARFVVNLRLTENSAQGDSKVAEDMANTVRNWRSFDFNEPGIGHYKKKWLEVDGG